MGESRRARELPGGDPSVFMENRTIIEFAYDEHLLEAIRQQDWDIYAEEDKEMSPTTKDHEVDCSSEKVIVIFDKE